MTQCTACLRLWKAIETWTASVVIVLVILVRVLTALTIFLKLTMLLMRQGMMVCSRPSAQRCVRRQRLVQRKSGVLIAVMMYCNALYRRRMPKVARVRPLHARVVARIAPAARQELDTVIAINIQSMWIYWFSVPLDFAAPIRQFTVWLGLRKKKKLRGGTRAGRGATRRALSCVRIF